MEPPMKEPYEKELYNLVTLGEQIRGTEFEAGDNGWCRYCGWAKFAHIIGAQTGRLYCPAERRSENP